MARQGEPRKPVDYVPPALRVLGKAHVLTQGPTMGGVPDGIFVMHLSTTSANP